MRNTIAVPINDFIVIKATDGTLPFTVDHSYGGLAVYTMPNGQVVQILCEVTASSTQIALKPFVQIAAGQDLTITIAYLSTSSLTPLNNVKVSVKTCVQADCTTTIDNFK